MMPQFDASADASFFGHQPTFRGNLSHHGRRGRNVYQISR
jgi:hypothetical protein